MNPFPEDTDLNAAIAAAYSDLEKYDADSDEYRKIVSQLTALYALRDKRDKINYDLYEFDTKHTLDVVQAEFEIDQAQLPFHKRIDPNTALTVAGNVFIGLAVIKYEQTGVVASKVWSFMRKL